MAGMSRRNVIGGIAVSGGFAMAQMGAASASADSQPPFGPTPAPLSGKELPSFKYRARRPVRQGLGRRLVEGGDGRRVPGVGEARRRPDAAFARRAARAALARQRRRMGLRHQGPLPRHHHRPAGPFRDRRLRCRRRLVLPARPRPLDPGPRPRRLPVSSSSSTTATSPSSAPSASPTGSAHVPAEVLAKNFGVPAVDLRRLSRSARSTWPRVRCRRRCRPIPRPARSTSAPLTHRYRLLAQRPRDVRRRLAAAGLGARVPDLDDHDRRPDAASSRAGCASCTGIRTRTSGSTTSRAARA